MNQTGILRYGAAVTTFGVAMAMSPQASAVSPVVYSYYPIAASGCATSLSAWRNGDTWVTGCGSSGDNMIFELIRSRSQPEQFQQRNFSAKQVAVDPASNPATPATVWALTTAGDLYQYLGSQTWTKYFTQPCVRSIGVGWNKTVWIIKCDNTIAYLSSSGTFISKGAPPETMTQVAVPLNGGNPWFIAQSGNIYMFNNTWNKKTGCATSIGIGGDGVPWVTGCGSNASGNVFRWNGSSFSQVLWNTQLNLKSIRVSLENIPWGLGDGTTYPAGTIVERTAELDFKGNYLPQMESNWCWAATTQSIYNYLTNGINASWAQCTYVNVVLGRSDCCNASQPCNQGQWEYIPLNHFGIKFNRVPNTPELWEGLVQQLSNNSPVIADYYTPDESVGHSEFAEGMYAFQGTQYVEKWNPLPVGVGTRETTAYPQFVAPPGLHTSWTIDAIRL
jgi:Papain-like cysteine protease AvrRpt2